MAQPAQSTPTLTANVAGTKQQVNLRDYLNARVAPFLKKALTESLNTEAEYPLQWLGEHLIQQSILFENNPDSTKIQERFLYKHDIPKATAAPPVAPQQAASAVAEDASVTPTADADSMTQDTPAVADAEKTTTEVNGTDGAAPTQDTEMTNAP